VPQPASRMSRPVPIAADEIELKLVDETVIAAMALALVGGSEPIVVGLRCVKVWLSVHPNDYAVSAGKDARGFVGGQNRSDQRHSSMLRRVMASRTRQTSRPTPHCAAGAIGNAGSRSG